MRGVDAGEHPGADAVVDGDDQEGPLRVQRLTVDVVGGLSGEAVKLCCGDAGVVDVDDGSGGRCDDRADAVAVGIRSAGPCTRSDVEQT